MLNLFGKKKDPDGRPFVELLDASETPDIQVLDVDGKRVKNINVTNNPELTTLIARQSAITEIDLTCNPKLEYFDCREAYLESLDLTSNKMLNHLEATSNYKTLMEIKAWAPESNGSKLIHLAGTYGGVVGLKFGPGRDKQGNEIGQLVQIYYAYPNEGFVFAGWFNVENECISKTEILKGTYGEAVDLHAMFMAI